MNKDKVLEVADALENMHEPDLGFNMGVFLGDTSAYIPDYSGHHCDTVACIAGHIVAMVYGRDELCDRFETGKTYGNVQQTAAEYLELNHTESMKLFLPCSSHYGNMLNLARAVKVLRDFAVTGKVDWNCQ